MAVTGRLPDLHGGTLARRIHMEKRSNADER